MASARVPVVAWAGGWAVMVIVRPPAGAAGPDAQAGAAAPAITPGGEHGARGGEQHTADGAGA